MHDGKKRVQSEDPIYGLLLALYPRTLPAIQGVTYPVAGNWMGPRKYIVIDMSGFRVHLSPDKPNLL